MKSVSKTRRLVLRFTKVILAGVALGLTYQNCSSVKFVPEEIASVQSPSGDPEVVCDPFSSGSACAEAGAGLLGNVYYLPDAIGSVQEYIDRGTKLNILVQLTNLNIPQRSWTDGFPGGTGVIKDPSGGDLIEYFALDLKGYLKLNGNQPEGDYQFAIASDDGAIFDLDGREIVNNDGRHSVTWACSKAPVNLRTNVIHQMRLRYYQGPRVMIALQVFYRPASESGRPCGENGNFKILPAEILYH